MKAKLYTWSTCPFCMRAKEVLQRNGVEFDEEVMDHAPAELEELKRRYGHDTVPIVLLDGEFVGGCDELVALEQQGKLIA